MAESLAILVMGFATVLVMRGSFLARTDIHKGQPEDPWTPRAGPSHGFPKYHRGVVVLQSQIVAPASGWVLL